VVQVLAEDSSAIQNVEAYGQCQKLLEQIQTAIRAGDVSAVRQAADTLRGPITSVIANEAFAAASLLENTAHQSDLTRAQDACRHLRTLLQILNDSH
jgi:hypothetical protein